MKTTVQLLKEAPTSALVAIYNSVSASPVTKFSDLAVGRERTLGALLAASCVVRDTETKDAKTGAEGLWVYASDSAPRKRVESGSRTDWKDDMVVEVLAAANPKRPSGASYKRFALYQTGMTVAAYKVACTDLEGSNAREPHGYLADLKWDTDRNFIAVHAADEWAAKVAEAEKAAEEAAEKAAEEAAEKAAEKAAAE